MFDSVYIFAAGLTALDRSHTLKPVNLSCELEQPWDDGLSLYNYINTVCEFYSGEFLHFQRFFFKTFLSAFQVL